MDADTARYISTDSTARGGNYRFSDFLKVGRPLMVGMLLIFAWLISTRFSV